MKSFISAIFIGKFYVMGNIHSAFLSGIQNNSVTFSRWLSSTGKHISAASGDVVSLTLWCTVMAPAFCCTFLKFSLLHPKQLSGFFFFFFGYCQCTCFTSHLSLLCIFAAFLVMLHRKLVEWHVRLVCKMEVTKPWVGDSSLSKMSKILCRYSVSFP